MVGVDCVCQNVHFLTSNSTYEMMSVNQLTKNNRQYYKEKKRFKRMSAAKSKVTASFLYV